MISRINLHAKPTYNEVQNMKWGIIDVIIVYALVLIIVTLATLIIILPAMRDFLNSSAIPSSDISNLSHFYYVKARQLVVVRGLIEQLCLAFLPIFWVKIRKYGGIKNLGLSFENVIRNSVVGIICGVGFRYIFITITDLLNSNSISRMANIRVIESNIFLYIANFVRVIIIGPIGESILFPGFTFPAFAKKFGPRIGVGITALLFVLAHTHLYYANKVPLQLFCFFFMEIIAILLYLRTKSLITTVVFHAIYNALIFIGI